MEFMMLQQWTLICVWSVGMAMGWVLNASADTNSATEIQQKQSGAETAKIQPLNATSQACGDPSKLPEYKSTIVFAGDLHGVEDVSRVQLSKLASGIEKNSRISTFLIPEIGFNSNFSDITLQAVKDKRISWPMPGGISYRNIGLLHQIWEPANGKLPDPTNFTPSDWSISPKINLGANIMEATANNLLLAASAIADDIRSLKTNDPNFDPRTYELTILIIGHGSPTGPALGFVWDANSKLYSYPPDEVDFSQFSQILPGDIRIKYAFEQCYGSDHALSLLQAHGSPATQCSCGISAAPVRAEARDTPFIEAFYEPMKSQPSNLSQLLRNVEANSFADSSSSSGGFRLTSDVFLEKYFLDKAKELGFGDIVSGSDLLFKQSDSQSGSFFKALLTSAPLTIGSLDQSILSYKINSLISLYGQIAPGVNDSIIQQTASDVFDKKMNLFWDKSNNILEEWVKSEFDGKTRTNFSAEFQLESDLQHYRLLKYFLQTASQSIKDQYLDLLACEATSSTI
jgi:hypothetical protein